METRKEYHQKQKQEGKDERKIRCRPEEKRKENELGCLS